MNSSKVKSLRAKLGRENVNGFMLANTNVKAPTFNSNTISQCSKYKYLGDFVSDGWDLLYTKRHEKAQGYAISCQAMATEISLGYQMYDVAKLLRQSLFINGTLVNMETWPNFTLNRILLFERTEQHLLRKILKAHSKTPVESIYLELGIVPFRFHLMSRRILY